MLVSFLVVMLFLFSFLILLWRTCWSQCSFQWVSFALVELSLCVLSSSAYIWFSPAPEKQWIYSSVWVLHYLKLHYNFFKLCLLLIKSPELLTTILIISKNFFWRLELLCRFRNYFVSIIFSIVCSWINNSASIL